jgi:hypothetical protein
MSIPIIDRRLIDKSADKIFAFAYGSSLLRWHYILNSATAGCLTWKFKYLDKIIVE